MSDLVNRLRIKAGMIEMGELIAWGSDTALMREAADALKMAAPAAQVEPVAFCEDAALSIAERTFSTEVDEQLAEDVIQYARRLHTLYTAPQPVEQQPDVTQMVEALEQVIKAAPSGGPLWHGSEQIVEARAALAAHRKQGGEE